MDQFIISKKALEITLSYLSQKPWAEAQPIIQELAKCQPVAAPPPPPTQEEPKVD